MVIEAGELRERAVARLVACGDRDQHRPRTRIALAKRARHLVAVDVRHADVEQHRVRREVAHLVEHVQAGIDAAYFVSVLAQEQHETLHGIAVIVGHQYA